MKKFACALLGLIALTGCTATTNGTATTGSAGPTTPAEPLPGDQLVIVVNKGGGLMDFPTYASDPVDLGIYGDGRVYRARDNGVGKSWEYELGHLDPQAVADLAAQVEASGLIDEKLSYGKPEVADGGSTTVAVHTSGEQQSATVYAPTITTGLSSAQADRRDAFVDLINDIEDLAAEAAFAEVTSGQVQVMQVKAWNEKGMPWPGPDPASFMQPYGNGPESLCGGLSGAEATAVLDAATENNFNRHWDVGGQIMVLAVKPLLPGTEPCADN